MKKAPSTYQASGACSDQRTGTLPPSLCPLWPVFETPAATALHAMIEGTAIGPRAFERITRTRGLGFAVFTLRALGWRIERRGAIYRLDGRYVIAVLRQRAEVLP